MAAPRWRCPLCHVIYWTARAKCTGGWPVYDPARPGQYAPQHREVPVVADPQTSLAAVDARAKHQGDDDGDGQPHGQYDARPAEQAEQ